MSNPPFQKSLLFLFALSILSGCGSHPETRLIASYPLSPDVAPEDCLPVSSSRLTMEVTDVDWAVNRATQIAYEAGGTVISQDSWREFDGRRAALTLAVPGWEFDTVYWALAGLGQPLSGEGYRNPACGDFSFDRNIPVCRLVVDFHPAGQIGGRIPGLDDLATVLLIGMLALAAILAAFLFAIFLVLLGKVLCWLSRI
jgi:hypothetical protein